MKILITGGKGAIGSLLAEALREKGHEILIYDLPEFDILNENQISTQIKKSDMVYHVAAIADLNFARENPKTTLDVNIIGTLNTAIFAAKHKKILQYVSTACVYGNQKIHPVDESICPAPTEIYAYSKLAGEEIIKGLKELLNLKANILRIGTTYGPEMRMALAPNLFLDKAGKGETIEIHGTGRQTRNYVFIEDLIEGMAKVVEKKIINETINLTGIEETSVLDIIKEVKRYYPKLKTKKVKDRPGQIFKERIKSDKAKKLLDWQPTTSFLKGMKKTRDWILSKKKQSVSSF